jgi:hypothetical protein
MTQDKNCLRHMIDIPDSSYVGNEVSGMVGLLLVVRQVVHN